MTKENKKGFGVPGEIAISVQSEQNILEINEFMKNKGYKWLSGESFIEYFPKLEINLILILDKNKKEASIAYNGWHPIGEKIITVEELCKLKKI